MEIELVKIEAVKPYPGNPRNNSGAVSKVAASIKEFGFRQPIVVDENMVVIAGHTRLLAAQALALQEVPVHIARGLSPKQVRAYRIADNRVGEEAEWDNDKLRAELAALKAEDFDLVLTGFDSNEIALALAGGLPGADPEATPEPEAVAASQLGDVWLLGPHRLVCGDSTDEGAVRAAVGQEKPHLMVTDPPYGVNYDPLWREGMGKSVVDGTVQRVKTGKVVNRFKSKAVGEVKNDDRADWREAWALFPGDVAYVWHGGLHASVVEDSLRACEFAIRAQIVWVKQNPVFSRGDYHWKHEPCWYAVRKGATGHWAGDRKQTTVWEIANHNPMGGNRTEPVTGHGTQKPVECMRRPIVNNSKAGDAVYDPFLGSGTTLIAAEMEGRRCFGIELNPVYVDVIIKRWQQFTGKEAVLERTGETFNSLRPRQLEAAE